MKHAQEVGDNTLMSPHWLQDPKFVIGTATPDQMSAITKASKVFSWMLLRLDGSALPT